ncbi:Multi-sensor hybrid histidine kinase [Candidatus Zixiibacteriota bacterium]|nr:Multi-sensor hybrid histidine kinase [candidate division Zixibacteria bacterium]
MIGESKRILVIDDESRMCHSLEQLLSSGGYEVTTTQSGRDGIKKIQSERFDLILTDIKMPEVSGMDILRTAREVDPELIIILMTGYASLETALEAIKNGAFEYLLKPVEFTQLEISVRRGLEKRAASLYNKRLLEDLKEANHNLNNRLLEINALYEAGKSLGSALNHKDLLHKIVTLAAGVTQAEIGSVMLINESGEYMTIEASIGLDRSLAETVQLPVGSSIAGYVAQSGKPLIIDDVEKDDRFQRINKERYSSASLLCAPLVITNRTLGVINMANKKEGEKFNEHDLKLLTTFAAQAAVAIDDARQFENNRQKLREFSLLFEISQKLSAVGSVSAMRKVVFEYLRKLMPIDFALWFEWEPIAQHLRPVGAVGTDIPMTDSGTINLDLIRREEITIEDIDFGAIDVNNISALSSYLSKKITDCPAYPRPGPNFTALPVLQEKELKHIYCIGSRSDRHYSDQEISLARLVISHASGLYEREKALLNATRLLTMGNMISEISHDLRKPLTNLKGWVQILCEKWPEVGKDGKFFGMAEEEIQRLNELVRELVDFSRPHKYETELRDLRKVIGRAAELLGPEFRKKNISFSEEYSDCNWEIPINKNQVLEVFLNLFINAVDAIDDGKPGTIHVHGEIGRPDFKKADYLAVTVTDNGHGIKKENLPRIFDRYYTTKDTGTGLGLSVVERIIAAHGGTLKVESDYGRGTDFTLYFPI